MGISQTMQANGFIWAILCIKRFINVFSFFIQRIIIFWVNIKLSILLFWEIVNHFLTLIYHTENTKLLLLSKGFDLSIETFDVRICIGIFRWAMIDLPTIKSGVYLDLYWVFLIIDSICSILFLYTLALYLRTIPWTYIHTQSINNYYWKTLRRWCYGNYKLGIKQ